jgi:hypothetical protein
LLRERHLEWLACAILGATVFLAIDLSYTELPRLADISSARRLAPVVENHWGRQSLVLSGPEIVFSLPFYLKPSIPVRQVEHRLDLGDYATFSGNMIDLSTDNDSFDAVRWYFPSRKTTILNKFGESRLLLIQSQPRSLIGTTQPAGLPSP